MDDPAATSATVAHGHRGATTTCRGGSGRAHGDTDDGSEMDNDNCESESEEEMVKEVMGVGDSIIHDSLGAGILSESDTSQSKMSLLNNCLWLSN
mmetsp:Transcript_18024/g.50602  ORF Transcript_18024/g.50602 Transcript_18024/m.50602 type:complete len:95 (+) Transcript_18024:196-480(+)